MTAHPPPALPPVGRILLLLLLLSPLALALPRLVRPQPEVSAHQSDHGEIGESGEGTSVAPATEATVVRPLPLRTPVLGFTINAHRIADLEVYLKAVESIQKLGANTLLVVTPMYQETISSHEIRPLASKCPTDSQLVAILQRGKEHGLQTFLMPIVLVEKARPKEWRGMIEPDDWDLWWQSYIAFIDHFLDIAGQADVDVLSIGSELNMTEEQIERWEVIARRVRNRFEGVVTYSANWDRYQQVEFWPLVDVISVSSYFELERDRPGAPEELLVEAWSAVQHDLRQCAERWRRPLLMSEIGYPSLSWSNAHPWNYVPEDGQGADHEAQARCWSAFFQAWSSTFTDPDALIVGFCGYRWDPYHQGGSGDYGYGIRGKPAMNVFREGLRQIGGS